MAPNGQTIQKHDYLFQLLHKKVRSETRLETGHLVEREGLEPS